MKLKDKRKREDLVNKTKRKGKKNERARTLVTKSSQNSNNK